MLKNYITIAIRNIQNSPVYSAINILGLTIGIVCSLLLYLYVQYEMSYDDFHTKGENIYRINANAVIQDTKLQIARCAAPMGPTLKEEYSEVQNFVRISGDGETLIQIDDKTFYENNIYFTDSSYFSVFDYQLLEGLAATCLQEPNSIVLSESLAKKLFPEGSAIGKIVKTGGGETSRKVTGIMVDPIINSHIRARGLISNSSRDANELQFWGNMSDQTYIQLSDGANPEIFKHILSKSMTNTWPKCLINLEHRLCFRFNHFQTFTYTQM